MGDAPFDSGDYVNPNSDLKGILMLSNKLRTPLIALAALSVLAASACGQNDDSSPIEVMPSDSPTTMTSHIRPSLTGLISIEGSNGFSGITGDGDLQLVATDPTTGERRTSITLPDRESPLDIRREQFSADWTMFVVATETGGVEIYQWSGESPSYELMADIPAPASSFSADPGGYRQPVFNPKDNRIWAFTSRETNPVVLERQSMFSFDPRNLDAGPRSEGRWPLLPRPDKWRHDTAGKPGPSREYTIKNDTITVEGDATDSEALTARITVRGDSLKSEIYDCPAHTLLSTNRFLCLGNSDHYGSAAFLTINLAANTVELRKAAPAAALTVEDLYPSPDGTQALLATTDTDFLAKLDGTSEPRKISRKISNGGKFLGWT